MSARYIIIVSVVGVAAYLAWRLLGESIPAETAGVAPSPQVVLESPAEAGSRTDRLPLELTGAPQGEKPEVSIDNRPPWEIDDELAGIAEEGDSRISRRRILTHCLHEFRRERERRGESLDPTGIESKEVQLLSIASILDAVGRGYDEPPKYKIEALKAQHGADHFYMLNGKYYAFKRGEFPEYDRVVDLQLAAMAASQKTKAALNFKGGLDSEYFDAVEARAIEALSILFSY